MDILVDVDGVVADLVTPILERVNKATNSSVKYDDITKFYFLDPKHKILTKEQSEVARASFSEPGLVESLSVIPGSQEGIQKLRDLGHDIIWVTSPWKESKTWCWERTRWLKEHFDTHSDDIIFASRKEKIPGKVFIDDRVKNVEAWQSKMGGAALLYDQPWNQDCNKVKRFTWQNIDGLIWHLDTLDRKWRRW
jgi:5'(3')-deoxyribonucleotidase